MTAVSGKMVSVGFRNAVAYAINQTTGLLDPGSATPTTPYEGVRISRSRALSMNVPEARHIVHFAEDRVFQLDNLPPTEPITGELRTANANQVLDALFGGIKVHTVGEATTTLIGSDQQGYEPQVAILGYQVALDDDEGATTLGLRRYRGILSSRSLLIRREGGMTDQPFETMFTWRPSFINAYPWGIPFTVTDDGAQQSQLIHAMTEGKPWIAVWKQTGVGGAFSFATDRPASAVNKIHVVTINGVLSPPADYTPGTTTTALGFDAGKEPAANATVVAFYERA